MKKNFMLAFALLFMGVLMSCSSEIKDGTTDIDNWGTDGNTEYVLNHPCMLHTNDDFAYVKSKVSAGLTPWKGAYSQLESSQYAVSSYKASPVEILKRLDQANWSSTYPDYSNYTNLMNDAAAAYQLSLRWEISGDELYAKAGIKILEDWMKTCKGMILKDGLPIDPNEFLINIQAYQLANAAEVLRGYNSWGESAEFKDFVSWMKSVFYPIASDFLVRHNNTINHYWLNWDLAQMTAILSIGILADDQEKINEAISYFKSGVGAGCIERAVVTMYDDPDEAGKKIGQCQESGRDQGHATLCAALMGIFCQMAYNIGEDLYTYDGGKAVAMAEYIAKYNLYKETEVNITGSDKQFVYSRTNFTYTPYYYSGEQMNELSAVELKNGTGETSRGTKRPCWDLWYGHCKKVGLNAKYCGEFAQRIRPDGGGGNYGSNSGGFDQVGFTTLMFYRE